MSEKNLTAGVIIGMILFAIIVVLLVVGPAGCYRSVCAWQAQAYGSDWLVIQYAQDGSVINHWELINTSVASESQSDGIQFPDTDGNMVHLSGHYVYAQVSGAQGMRVAKSRYLQRWDTQKVEPAPESR